MNCAAAVISVAAAAAEEEEEEEEEGKEEGEEREEEGTIVCGVYDPFPVSILPSGAIYMYIYILYDMYDV